MTNARLSRAFCIARRQAKKEPWGETLHGDQAGQLVLAKPEEQLHAIPTINKIQIVFQQLTTNKILNHLYKYNI
ncbi:hypothetical protein [Chromobacterium haemolyticum]|uniref:hypothetical protein n=1 Tax=Chromobacterium haemolyticum TaxID=394935 RepID=UPI0011789570|nr:hypothetical protein [Chromobacterium haemolyticum]